MSSYHRNRKSSDVLGRGPPHPWHGPCANVRAVRVLVLEAQQTGIVLPVAHLHTYLTPPPSPPPHMFRRHALVALKREENEWKASAMERARSDVRAAADGTTADEAGSSGGCGALEERVRESIVEGGPGAAARKAVGLVRIGGVDGVRGGFDDGGALAKR